MGLFATELDLFRSFGSEKLQLAASAAAPHEDKFVLRSRIGLTWWRFAAIRPPPFSDEPSPFSRTFLASSLESSLSHSLSLSLLRVPDGRRRRLWGDEHGGLLQLRLSSAGCQAPVVLRQRRLRRPHARQGLAAKSCSWHDDKSDDAAKVTASVRVAGSWQPAPPHRTRTRTYCGAGSDSSGGVSSPFALRPSPTSHPRSLAPFWPRLSRALSLTLSLSPPRT